MNLRYKRTSVQGFNGGGEVFLDVNAREILKVEIKT